MRALANAIQRAFGHLKSNKSAYPNQFSQLTSCFQVVTHSNPSNNLMADMGKVGVQLWFPLTGLEGVVFNKGQLKHFANFCQIEDKSSIVVVWTIVWNNKRLLPCYIRYLLFIVLKLLLCNFLNFEMHKCTLYMNKRSQLPTMLKSTLKHDILYNKKWEFIVVDNPKQCKQV